MLLINYFFRAISSESKILEQTLSKYKTLDETQTLQFGEFQSSICCLTKKIDEPSYTNAYKLCYMSDEHSFPKTRANWTSMFLLHACLFINSFISQLNFNSVVHMLYDMA